MESDIVERLRAVLQNDRSVELMNREAADEIERLRGEMLMYAELMNKANDQIKHLRLTVEAWLQYSQRAERDIAEFRDELARITKSTGMGFAHNHRVIDRLTAERDEARRAVCCGALPPEYRGWGQEAVNLALKAIAKQQGWDCYEGKA